MELVISGLVAVLFVALCHNAIHAAPIAFYALAFAIDALYAVGLCFALPDFVWSVLLVLVQRCQLAIMLFAIVMFAGALPKTSAVRHALIPIRGELSLIATILAAAHVGYHASMLIGQVGLLASLPATRLVSFSVAVILVVLLAILSLTSIAAVRAHMDPVKWKVVQRLAYVFFGLAYVHVALIFVPSLLAGTMAVWQRFALYTALFGAYALCRIGRRVRDRSVIKLTREGSGA